MSLAYNHFKNKTNSSRRWWKRQRHLLSKSKPQGQSAVMTWPQPLKALVKPWTHPWKQTKISIFYSDDLATKGVAVRKDFQWTPESSATKATQDQESWPKMGKPLSWQDSIDGDMDQAAESVTTPGWAWPWMRMFTCLVKALHSIFSFVDSISYQDKGSWQTPPGKIKKLTGSFLLLF